MRGPPQLALRRLRGARPIRSAAGAAIVASVASATGAEGMKAAVAARASNVGTTVVDGAVVLTVPHEARGPLQQALRLLQRARPGKLFLATRTAAWKSR